MQLEARLGDWAEVGGANEVRYCEPEYSPFDDNYRIIQDHYGVRLAMPGCTDCTDWQIFADASGALPSAAELIAGPDRSGEPGNHYEAYVLYVEAENELWAARKNDRPLEVRNTIAEATTKLYHKWFKLSHPIREMCRKAHESGDWEEVAHEVLIEWST